MSKLDTITDRMSKLMLKRWAMLAEQCNIDSCGAPLMRNPETKEPMCVWHHWFEISGEEPEPEAESKSDNTTENDKESIKDSSSDPKLYNQEYNDHFEVESKPKSVNSELKKKREQSQKASELIGKKMLQGWSLIDRICPNESCYSIPLVRDQELYEHCVICNLVYISEENYQKMNKSKKKGNNAAFNADSKNKRKADNAVENNNLVAKQDNIINVKHTDDDDNNMDIISSPIKPQTKITNKTPIDSKQPENTNESPQKSLSVLGNKILTSTNHNQQQDPIEYTISVLKSELVDLSNCSINCAVSNPKFFVKLTKSIKYCAEAIKALEAIKQ
ncbi:hypothetical protein H4219_004555 [Mycoemilia scoparia]|uniref:Uncharacterized protein n=1 Tax=Mycoemilia scoparia TaxID=417184 RepID=A0A9W8DRP0_9FUNG|nr:hypothetical protein H4219_004555 [Mycoemilia scoparia]